MIWNQRSQGHKIKFEVMTGRNSNNSKTLTDFETMIRIFLIVKIQKLLRISINLSKNKAEIPILFYKELKTG